MNTHQEFYLFLLVLSSIVFIGAILRNVSDFRTRQKPDRLTYARLAETVGYALLLIWLYGQSVTVRISAGVMLVLGTLILLLLGTAKIIFWQTGYKTKQK